MDRNGGMLAQAKVASPITRGIPAIREQISEGVHRLRLINQNLEQGIMGIYGPFPPSSEININQLSDPDDLVGMLQLCMELLQKTEQLSTTLNTGH